MKKKMMRRPPRTSLDDAKSAVGKDRSTSLWPLVRHESRPQDVTRSGPPSPQSQNALHNVQDDPLHAERARTANGLWYLAAGLDVPVLHAMPRMQRPWAVRCFVKGTPV